MGRDRRTGSYQYRKVRQDDEEAAGQSKAQKKKEEEKRKEEQKKKDEKKKLEKTVKFQTEIPPEEGVSLVVLICFILSDTLGLSLLLSPAILKYLGWYGVPFTLLVFPMLIYTGFLLCKAFQTASIDRDTAQDFRDPYPFIVESATGKVGRIVFLLIFSIFQTTVCVIALAAIANIMYDMLPSLLPGVSDDNNIRVWIAVWGATLFLFLLPGSPKQSWIMAIIVCILSILGAILIISLLGMLQSYKNFTSEIEMLRINRQVEKSHPTALDVFLQVSACIGGMMWTFGPHAIYPTLQADSKDNEDLPKAIGISYIILVLFTIVICCMAYAIFGETLKENLLDSLSSSHLYNVSNSYRGLLLTLKILLCIHVGTVYILNINPISLWLENAIEISADFCWQRVVIRAAINFVITGAAVAVPSFVPAIRLTGGLLTSLLCIVFPAICYIKLEENKTWYHYVCVALTMVLTFTIAVLSSYANIARIVSSITGF